MEANYVIKDKRKHHGTVDKHSSEQHFINLMRLPDFVKQLSPSHNGTGYMADWQVGRPAGH